jgi:hypothetical protein
MDRQYQVFQNLKDHFQLNNVFLNYVRYKNPLPLPRQNIHYTAYCNR